MGRSCPVHDIPQFDCTDCSNVATIRQAAADGRIELASTVLVEALESYVERVLTALGHPEALVTDLSTIVSRVIQMSPVPVIENSPP